MQQKFSTGVLLLCKRAERSVTFILRVCRHRNTDYNERQNSWSTIT